MNKKYKLLGDLEMEEIMIEESLGVHNELTPSKIKRVALNYLKDVISNDFGVPDSTLECIHSLKALNNIFKDNTRLIRFDLSSIYSIDCFESLLDVNSIEEHYVDSEEIRYLYMCLDDIINALRKYQDFKKQYLDMSGVSTEVQQVIKQILKGEANVTVIGMM